MSELSAGLLQDADEQFLRPLWAEVCKGLSVPKQHEDRWWQIIQTKHSESHRYYHTLSHLHEMFDYLEEHRSCITDRFAVMLAIFFHDIIYDPRSGSPKNEEDSAELFATFALESLPLGSLPDRDTIAKCQMVDKVSNWIVQTAHHRCSTEDETDCKYFMDFDMAVLGRSWNDYLTYAHQVRLEYCHISEAVWCRARSGFLINTSVGPPIFATAKFRDAREQQARDNMRKEADKLTCALRQCSFASRTLSNFLLSLKTRRATMTRCAQLLGLGLAGTLASSFPGTALRGFYAAALAGSCAACYIGGKLLCSKSILFPYSPIQSRSDETVLLAGSFNPPHSGHLALLRYLSAKHTKVFAVIGINKNKKYGVSAFARQELLRTMLRELKIDNVDVVICSGYIWRFALKAGVSVMYRGIRSWKKDAQEEKILECLNIFGQLVIGRRCPIQTVYIHSDPAMEHFSSTYLRTCLASGKDISHIVPAGATDLVSALYKAKVS